MITTTARSGEKLSSAIASQDVAALISGEQNTVWIDVESPTENELKWLEDTFQFHPLCIDDCRTFSNSPKLDEYDHFLFLVTHDTYMEDELAVRHEMDFFLGKNYLVSVHQKPSRSTKSLHSRCEARAVLAVFRQPAIILHAILDELPEDIFPILNRWEEKMDMLEARVFSNQGHHVLNDIMNLKRQLAELRRNLAMQQDVISKLIHTDVIIELKNSRFLFRDLHNQLIRLHDLIENQRDALGNILEIHYSSLTHRIGENSHKVNLVMQRLTIITTIFMPLSFMAGIYGMNFEEMPGTKNPNGFLILIGFMLFIASLMYFSFRRKKIF